MLHLHAGLACAPKRNLDARYFGDRTAVVHIIKMVGERVVSNAIKALRPFRNNVDNMFAFEEEVKVTLNSLYEKHRQGQTSIERARQSLIQFSPLLEREIKIWCKMIYRRLSARTRAHNAWRVQLKRAMPMEVFIFILQAVKNTRSAYGHTKKKS